VPVVPRAGLVTEVVRVLDAAGIEVDDVALRRPSLDDVFHALTGRDADPAPGLPATTTGIVRAAGTTATTGITATTAPAGHGPPDDGGAAAGPGGERAA
jgi:ABC-2 type transport system ATP-binding protein